ncbi:MAG: pyrophosphatase PpaX [Parcubacteria group bacterium Gr01-1014_8]|nr:MAG: pyrophosphatase PpaX [Parcubacteria group bacterium Gr01-1014_8]
MTKAVLFDVDGTLLDTYEYIIRAYEHVTTEEGAPISRATAVLLASQGKTLRENYEMLFPEKDALRLMQAHRDFQEKNLQLVMIFPNVKETLQTLKDKGIKLATVTNRMRKSSIATMQHVKIVSMFDALLSQDDVTRAKPDPEHVSAALRAVDVEAKDAWFVGDTPVDIQAGKAAGVGTIGISYGPHADLVAYEPDHIVYTIEDILPIVLHGHSLL